jgi:16S rRNA processing protein RimM
VKEGRLVVARIGKTVGLRGDLRLHILCDFPQQFKKGASFESDRGLLTVAAFSPDRQTVRFEGYTSVEAAKPLTNLYLYTDRESSEAADWLKEGEYFWHQIEGLEVVEADRPLGRVARIERMAGTDYLLVETDQTLVKEGAAHTFFIPYIDRYIRAVDLDGGRIVVEGARDILEAS